MKAWVPLLAYPAQEAPHYKYGYKISAGLWGLYLIGVPFILWFSKKYPTKKRDIDVDEDDGKDMESTGSRGDVAVKEIQA
jgi:ACS family pantothenate transporter-like MFS transporter